MVGGGWWVLCVVCCGLWTLDCGLWTVFCVACCVLCVVCGEGREGGEGGAARLFFLRFPFSCGLSRGAVGVVEGAAWEQF